MLSPIQGFGKMWQKTYRVSLADTDVTPQEAIAVWKDEFPAFWPKGSQFYAPLTGISPGEVALLQASLGGGLKLSTGILVIYADEESFTFMTPQGHMFAGWITFSAFEQGRRDHGAGAGPDAGAGSADRARSDARRSSQGGCVLARNAAALAERLGSERPSPRRPSSASSGDASGREPGTCVTTARSGRGLHTATSPFRKKTNAGV